MWHPNHSGIICQGLRVRVWGSKHKECDGEGEGVREKTGRECEGEGVREKTRRECEGEGAKEQYSEGVRVRVWGSKHREGGEWQRSNGTQEELSYVPGSTWSQHFWRLITVLEHCKLNLVCVWGGEGGGRSEKEFWVQWNSAQRTPLNSGHPRHTCNGQFQSPDCPSVHFNT